MKSDKNSNTVNATRSKHSATEQRRRSKINERYSVEAEKCHYYIVFSSLSMDSLKPDCYAVDFSEL